MMLGIVSGDPMSISTLREVITSIPDIGVAVNHPRRHQKFSGNQEHLLKIISPFTRSVAFKEEECSDVENTSAETQCL